MKTFIGINTLTAVEQLAYANHVQFFYRLGKHYPNDTFALNTPRRMSIDRMRNLSAKMALEAEYDYLLFIDDDVIVPLNLFDQLLAAQQDIVAAWTIIRGYPYENMFFKKDDKGDLKNMKGIERGSGLVDCDAIGFSAALIKVDLLRKIPPPWFVTGPTNTEDIYFCLKARRYVPDCTISVQTNAETAHILGPEFIAPWNMEDYKKYYEGQNPDVLVKDNPPFLDDSGDRGSKYVDMVKGDLPLHAEKT